MAEILEKDPKDEEEKNNKAITLIQKRANYSSRGSNPYISVDVPLMEEGSGSERPKSIMHRSFSRTNGPHSECDCDECLLGIGDQQLDLKENETHNKLVPLRSWRKLRNVFLLTPFFQHSKNKHYPWIQLAGHQDNFRAGHSHGTILKRYCARESKCLQILMNDELRDFVPLFRGDVDIEDHKFVEMEDLLLEFDSPSCMDCKLGTRTYLETELTKAREDPEPRPDMYEKMIEVDPNEPTPEEHERKAVTKVRYMQWRETVSSTASLGFRIDGIRKAGGGSVNTKSLKTLKERKEIKDCFAEFTSRDPHILRQYVARLQNLSEALQKSQFFKHYEVIGSSLLFVHDEFTPRPKHSASRTTTLDSNSAIATSSTGPAAPEQNNSTNCEQSDLCPRSISQSEPVVGAPTPSEGDKPCPVLGTGGSKDSNAMQPQQKRGSVWMIDFGKTAKVPDKINITHDRDWIEGNHEDGYLFGLKNVRQLLDELLEELLAETAIVV